MYRFLLLVVVILLAACSPVVSETSQLIPTIDSSDTELIATKLSYERLCAHCHGYSGEGQPTGGGPGTVERSIELGYHPVPMHNAEGHTWQHADQILFEMIKYGARSPMYIYIMPPHAGQLTDDEIFDIIDYIKRFWTPEQRTHQAQITENFLEANPNWEEYHLDIYSEEQDASNID
ncbi:MAG: cytochrome C [Anaerolineaceae bacterium]|nr:cytochrome C [Anaerolineaceae bacterium]MCA9881419.1 cytochrome c [Anaerolineae bacterium]MCA9886732.1 cytochrome c [Anaerolineae bacterium]MCA9891357.1 cytochrome c [Anaerolineae bacterium]